jgi:hypothetical protein
MIVIATILRAFMVFRNKASVGRGLPRAVNVCHSRTLQSITARGKPRPTKMLM